MPQFANTKLENSPNAIALADPYHSYTWVETNEILNRCANNILESDLGEKRRVAVFAENAGETAFAHLGALLGGASSVPVNFHLTAEEAAYILEDSESHILFVGPHTLERGLEAARQAGRSRWTAAAASPSDPPACRCSSCTRSSGCPRRWWSTAGRRATRSSASCSARRCRR